MEKHISLYIYIIILCSQGYSQQNEKNSVKPYTFTLPDNNWNKIPQSVLVNEDEKYGKLHYEYGYYRKGSTTFFEKHYFFIEYFPFLNDMNKYTFSDVVNIISKKHNLEKKSNIINIGNERIVETLLKGPIVNKLNNSITNHKLVKIYKGNNLIEKTIYTQHIIVGKFGLLIEQDFNKEVKEEVIANPILQDLRFKPSYQFGYIDENKKNKMIRNICISLAIGFTVFLIIFFQGDIIRFFKKKEC